MILRAHQSYLCEHENVTYNLGYKLGYTIWKLNNRGVNFLKNDNPAGFVTYKKDESIYVWGDSNGGVTDISADDTITLVTSNAY